MTFNLVFVCSANVCRSPLAEAIADRHLSAAEVEGVAVTSVGVAATGSVERCPAASRWLGSTGRQVPVHVSRALTASVVDEADLVLTMDRRILGVLLTQTPRARARSFTLREAVWLARAVEPQENAMPSAVRAPTTDPSSLSWFVGEMNARRGLVPVGEASRRRLRRRHEESPYDIADVHHGESTHRRVLPLVAQSTLSLLDTLFVR